MAASAATDAREAVRAVVEVAGVVAAVRGLVVVAVLAVAVTVEAMVMAEAAMAAARRVAEPAEERMVVAWAGDTVAAVVRAAMTVTVARVARQVGVVTAWEMTEKAEADEAEGLVALAAAATELVAAAPSSRRPA